MTENQNSRESELVLPPGQFAYVLDKTKGHVTTYCGPHKASLSSTDQPVTYDPQTQRFKNVGIESSTQIYIVAKKGEYIVLHNPADTHPADGKPETLPSNGLQMGKMENVPGPISFPLWPGQYAKVIKGHHLRSNQYLVVRVYDEEEAKKNKDSAIIRTPSSGGKDKEKEKPTEPTKNVLDVGSFSIGKLIVIKGTEISFYIPPTGIEVISIKGEEFTRNAVTLERLEYCILKDENGDTTYRTGPDVVFPTPTQDFVSSSGEIKFPAYELNDHTGLYIKVIESYDDKIKGQELFITGKDQAIYFPRPEHSIIRYGQQERHYAIAIPKGESRYVLNRDTGEVDTVKGPQMFLPDPRRKVVVRKILDDNTCSLYYPGNNKALEHNESLRDLKTETDTDYITEESFYDLESSYSLSKSTKPQRSRAFADSFKRGTSFTPPRTVTLDTKFDGAVSVDVWTGYAVQVVDKEGNRKVVRGPQTVTLEYDEYLERLTLSKGKPKSRNSTLQTVYLRVLSNPVSDHLRVKTKDLVDVDIDLKYLVTFDKEQEDKWFDVENYVQYLSDHMRSLISNFVRQINIQEFYSNATELIRDLILGKRTEEGRPNKPFEENGMVVYDLEVINIVIQNDEIAELLTESNQEILRNTIDLEREQRNLLIVKAKEKASRETKSEQAETTALDDQIALEELIRRTEKDRTVTDARNEIEMKLVRGSEEKAKITNQIERDNLELEKEQKELSEEFALKELERTLSQLKAESTADVDRMTAVTPGLVEAITAMSQTSTLHDIAEHLAPLAMVRGESLAGTLRHLTKDTPLEKVLDNLQKITAVGN